MMISLVPIVVLMSFVYFPALPHKSGHLAQQTLNRNASKGKSLNILLLKRKHDALCWSL
jgi:hypothetical protein